MIKNFYINFFGKVNINLINSNLKKLEKIFKTLLLVKKKNKKVVIIISSSGCSRNLLMAAQITKRRKLTLITLSGFLKSNPLKKIGNINLWVNSKAYNIVETVHQFWLLSVVDKIIGKMEYSS